MTSYQELVAAIARDDSDYIKQHLPTTNFKDEEIYLWLLEVAYQRKRNTIVEILQNSGFLTIHSQMVYACFYGEKDFVCRIISENRDVDHSVKWDKCLIQAYENNQEEIVRLIQMSHQLTIHQQLSLACSYGDANFVDQVISENRDSGHDVDWGHCLSQACVKKMKRKPYPFLIRTIVTNRNTQPRFCSKLMVSCMCGNFEYVKHHLAAVTQVSEDKKCYFRVAFHNKTIVELLVKEGIVTLKDFIMSIYRSDETEMLLSVIEHTPDINVELKAGFTALHITCCHRPDISILKALVTRGANVQTKGYMGRTGLHMLCQGEDDTIRQLIEGEGPVQVEQERDVGISKVIKHQGQQAQMWTVECLEYLIQQGGLVNAQDNYGQSAIHLLACCSQSLLSNLEVKLRILLGKDGDMNQHDLVGMTPLALAALHGNISIMNILIQKQCDVNKSNIEGKSPVFISCEWGQLTAATILSDNDKVNIDKVDNDHVTPLSISCGFGHTAIVSMLLSKKANAEIPDKDGIYAIHRAVSNRHYKAVTELIKHKVPLDVQDINGNTPLHYAVRNGDAQLTTLLLESKCNVNVQNSFGETPIMIANLDIESPLISALVKRHADLSMANIYGESVLTKAVASLNKTMLLNLLTCNVHIRCRNNKQQGLFHTLANKLCNTNYTAELEETINSMIDILVKEDLDINAQDINIQTPLHLTAKAGCVAATSILLDHGADVTARDRLGFLPLMWAVPYDEVFKILWDKTLQHLNDNDFKTLVKLGHWHNNIAIVERFPIKMRQAIDLSTRAQNFIKPAWFCNEDFSEFYTSNNEKLNAAQFETAWLSTLQKFTYIDHEIIVNTLSAFIQEVLHNVGEIDPLMACYFRLSGSEREKAKINATDEVDALSVLTAITFDMFKTPDEPAHPILKEFVKLHCKEEYRDHLKRVLDRDYYLSRSKLYHYYSAALSRVLSNPNLWAKYPNIMRLSHKDITAGNRTITPLMVLWSDDVYPLLLISIDMVPALDLPSNWRPTWASTHPLLAEMQCLIVPKWKTTAPEDDNMMEVGISHWAEAFAKMPMAMRNGYRMAKVVKELCPQILLNHAERSKKSNKHDDWNWCTISDCVTSYMMKQCIIKQYAAAFYDKSSKEIVIKTDREWAITIYKMMEEAFAQQGLSSFFIPQYNLLYDAKFAQTRDQAIKYAQLCQQLLTVKAAERYRSAYMGIKVDEVSHMEIRSDPLSAQDS